MPGIKAAQFGLGCMPAESIGPDNSTPFDVVCSRAFASLLTLTQWSANPLAL
jgi:16S rRNA G527 N7-methylase RsmG